MSSSSQPDGPEQLGEMYHVTLSVCGDPMDEAALEEALHRLAEERPFLLSARFARDRAEVRYWEEARCLDDAAALALRLWGEHRASAGLPAWEVVGLEVVDRDTYHWRMAQPPAPALVPAGEVAPF
ncbi:hypothetical protein [Motilibacter aurantiacus]|uniref:hypothetical protein n=1 Tax=Motilibacter aurantiacus TaxID=2714955 RepID=UPI00140BB1A5|nr:hypothetical protein [Motilibacter aurantiacus]NHC45092.1 hypothetical protein [Motilibacter aurantiacus]